MGHGIGTRPGRHMERVLHLDLVNRIVRRSAEEGAPDVLDEVTAEQLIGNVVWELKE